MAKRGPKPKPRITPEFIHCSRCGQDKSSDKFYKCSRTVTQRQPYCKPCQNSFVKPELRRVVSRRYYANNKARCQAYTVAWMARNPDKVREYRRPGQRAYKARKRAAFTLPFSRDQLGARIAYYGWRCWLCGSTWQQVDHVKPLARGGSHILANLRPICSRCNQSKKAAWPMASVMARFVEKESG